jgi:hypothetical protein
MRQPIHYPARHAVARASLPRGFVRLGLVCLAMSILTAGTSAAAPSGRSPGGMPDTFLKQHCVRCHDGKVQEGQFRLDTLDRSFTSLLAAERGGASHGR